MKNSTTLDEKIILYLYDELTGKEKADFESELTRNPGLKERLREMQAFYGMINRKVDLVPAETVLKRLRNRLHVRLQEERLRQNRGLWLEKVRFFFEIRHRFLAFAGAVGLLLLGVLLGKFLSAGNDFSNELANYSPAHPAQHEDAFITGVDFIQYDPKTGMVTVQYKSVEDVSVRGKMDDPSIRKLLAYAVREDTHPGRRLAAVKAMGGQRFSDPELEAALIYAMENDSVAGVRLKAAKVLQTLPMTATIKQAFMKILVRDPNSAIRIEALNALASLQGEMDLRPVLKEASDSDTNEFVRMKAARALEKTENPQVPK